MHVHHVDRLEDGGEEYDIRNLVTWCRSCHHEHHAPDHLDAEQREWRAFVRELL